MVNIALTFDYELFFGENLGTYDEVLFNPTSEILDLLDKHGIKATFFADVLSVYMQEKAGQQEYCDKFTKQIKDMAKRGHDVQLHIHSNWLKSKFKDGKWDFDLDSYAIHSFGFDESNETSVQNIIRWGKDYLESNLKPINPEYCCVAYRAGGYKIQPHGELFKVLNDNGIFIDSSVAVQQKSGGVNNYDYTNIYELDSWWIGENSPLEVQVSPDKGQIYEVPVGYCRASLLRMLFKPDVEKILKLSETRGTFIGKSTQKKKPVKGNKIVRKLKLLKTYGKTYRLLSVDSVHYVVIIDLLKKLSKKGKDITLAAIGHPKLAEKVWLENFDCLLEQLKKSGFCKCVCMNDIWQNEIRRK